MGKYDINFKRTRADLKAHVKRFFLHPDFWRNPDNSLNTPINWLSIQFVKENKNEVPQSSGIYCFVVKPNLNNFIKIKYLFYVGKTGRTLRVRFGEYLREKEGKGKPRIKVEEMLNEYKDNIYFYFAEIEDPSVIDDYEKKLLNCLVPPVNSAIPTARIKRELRCIYES